MEQKKDVMQSIMQELEEKANVAVRKANEALADGNFTQVSRAVTSATDALKELAKYQAQKVYKSLWDEIPKDAENKGNEYMMNAVCCEGYVVSKLQAHKNDAKVITKYTIESKEVPEIDLVSLKKYCDNRTDMPLGNDDRWANMVDRAAIKFTIAKANNVMKALPDGFEDIFTVQTAEREIEEGKNPTSKKKLIDVIQCCVDAMVFIPDKDGKNELKVTKHDLNYVVDVIGGFSDTKHKVKPVTRKEMARAMNHVLDKLINNKVYGVVTQIDEKTNQEYIKIS